MTAETDSIERRKSPPRPLPRFSLRILILGCVIASVFLGRAILRFNEQRDRRSRMVPATFDYTMGKNILWSAPLGSIVLGNPVVHDGKVLVGTNNMAAYLDRYPENVDLGVLLCFNAADGQFLWQASSKKLLTGRAHDWPTMGIASMPCVENDRLWYVTNRCEVVCLDLEGFHDGEDDGQAWNLNTPLDKREADVVWSFNMMQQLGVSPHHMSTCSPCIDGERVFVVTGHFDPTMPGEPQSSPAPSFIALDRDTGKILWSDDSSSENCMHGQWGSPTYAVLGGVPQVIFPGGDGWLYSFDPKGQNGKSKLLWRFDCNPKTSVWKNGGTGDRLSVLAPPTADRDRVYFTVGANPEQGEGLGRVWCIDPTKRGDLSAELAFDSGGKPLAARRGQAVDPDAGEYSKPNPNSGVVWKYDGTGKSGFQEQMNRSLSRVVIEEDLVLFTDFSGLVHCLDRATGKRHWAHDLYAGCMTSPVVSAEHILVADTDGQVNVFALSSSRRIAFPGTKPVASNYLPNAIMANPLIHDGVLYIASEQRLYAIGNQ